MAKRIGNMYLKIGVLLFSGLMALISPNTITDTTNETMLVGSQWFGQKLIPLVQSYSHYGPLSLWLANWWDQLIGNGVISRLFDFGIAVCLAALVLFLTRKLRFSKVQSSLITLLFIVSALGAGALERGPSPLKLGLLFSLMTITFFEIWKDSSASYWLMGKTDHNWRFLLLSGALFSLSVFTEPVFVVLLAPYVLVKISSNIKNYLNRFSARALFIVPTLLHLWLWISFFDSRNLMEQWIETNILHFSYINGVGLGRLGSLSFIPLSVIVYMSIYNVRRENFVISRVSWAMSLLVLLLTILIPQFIITVLPLVLVMYFINQNTTKLERFESVVKYACLTCIILAIVAVAAVSPEIKLERSQADLAKAYIQQRSIDQDNFYFYGRGAGLYDSSMSPSTSFVDSRVFKFDRKSLGLVNRFRGENEANSTVFLLVANDKLNSSHNERINEYIKDHYEKTASTPGFDIFKRK